MSQEFDISFKRSEGHGLVRRGKQEEASFSMFRLTFHDSCNYRSDSFLMTQELKEALPKRCYKISVMKARALASFFGLTVPFLLTRYYKFILSHRHLFETVYSYVISFSLSLTSWKLTIVSVDVFLKLFRPQKTSLGNLDEKIVQAEVLHDPGPNARQADIIFIHGIKGALEKTWTQGMWRLGQFRVSKCGETVWSSREDMNGNEYSSCWPRDWLPRDCPHARVIALNYTTDPLLWRPFWFSKSNRSAMSERSWEMIESLVDLGVGKHSIIWVGHSKGGLYVKQVLVHACETSDEKYKRLSLNTKGVLFYSVPHRGSILANLNIPLFRQSIELMEVQKDCQEVLTLHKKFKSLLMEKKLDINVKSFIETQLTFMFCIYLRIVSEESGNAEVGDIYGVPLDHRNICKPKSRECFLYRELVSFIKSTCDNIPA